jgi:hypothetical protein
MKEEAITGLIYGGLIIVGVYMVQPFLVAPSLDTSAEVFVIAFAVAISVLAAAHHGQSAGGFPRLANDLRHRQSRSRDRAAGAFVGIVAGFWHITWVAA